MRRRVQREQPVAVFVGRRTRILRKELEESTSLRDGWGTQQDPVAAIIALKRPGASASQGAGQKGLPDTGREWILRG